MFTRQFKVQIGKSTDIIKKSKSECRLWREINNLSNHRFPHGTRPLHLATENGRTQSVRDGYQSVASRADILLANEVRLIP